MPQISLVIVDDHQVVREGLRTLLEREPECSVVGDGGSTSTVTRT